MNKVFFPFLLFLILKIQAQNSPVQLIILGTVQDGGSPHIGCKKSCCKALFEHPDPTRKVVSLGLLDKESKKKYLFEASPDIGSQLEKLASHASDTTIIPDGIFLTHAHIGHYSGLMFLGKEALNSKNVPVYCMPRMFQYLSKNGPWSQLKQLNNIVLKRLKEDSVVLLSPKIKVIPILVPHRDEYSETVGFKIIGPTKTVLFIPDINKWSIWKRDIKEELKKVDYLFCDATFYDGAELTKRNISEIPHPFIIESMNLFSSLSVSEKNKIYFIHFNHTNPCLNKDSEATRMVIDYGYRISTYGMTIDL